MNLKEYPIQATSKTDIEHALDNLPITWSDGELIINENLTMHLS